MARVMPLFSDQTMNDLSAFRNKVVGAFDNRKETTKPVQKVAYVDQETAAVIRKNEQLFSGVPGPKIDQNVNWLDPLK